MTNFLRRSMLTCALAAVLPATLSLNVQAADKADAAGWPSRPIRLVVSYPAGGVSDVVARALGEKLSQSLGQSVVIDNKAGAGGAIGLDQVAKSNPDGYTLGFSSISPLTLSPHLGKPLFDPRKDIVPVVSVMYSPVLLLGTTRLTAKSFPELMTQAKAHPGDVRWATAGLASLGHIMLEQIADQGKVQITHVPYKGGGQQLNDGLSAQFEVLSTNAGPAVMQHIKAGKFKALAVGAPARLDSLPQVPTLAELGYKNANTTSVFGIFAPAGVPAPVLARLNAEVNKALALPEIRQRLEATDNVPTGGKAADFAKQIEAESRSNAQIIKAAGIQTN
ncbi:MULTISPECIES: tripartite tricarboxylate transporter substrate binding protein [Comamonas]|uniref:ABC transporter substrate-binding protein n=2 Tax=Comamonas testosteroni TaxID=285 RepID=A0A096H4G5_COMTE|nr:MULTISPECIES: tripartite tricarboxylate transporter substrate binding protein [Comamonas]KGH32330.1 ABC transporter substrate-binding protein [Comamonas testosteroni]MPT09094.1 tripartite tricarboxylate transporter substrate binding protein [Comamonas sp.]